MRILFVSYFFPPDKSVGGYRASSIVKTFIEEEIEIDLLTANLEISSSEKLKKDYNLENVYYAKESKIRKIGYKTKILAGLELLNLDKFLFFPDVYCTWITRALKKGNEIFGSQKIDAIFATVPPYSSAVVGYKLSKKHNVPLILDYRDPWTNNPTFKLPRLCVRKRHKKLETKISNHALMNVTVGDGYADLLSESSGVERDSYYIINNGFFEENIPSKQSEKLKDKFTVSFFGNYYKVHKLYFKELVLGIRKMIDEHNLTEKDFRLEYAGLTSRSVIKKDLEKGNLVPFFKDLGYLSGKKIVEEIQKSHVNFVIVPKSNEYVIFTKLYDYMIGNSHILIVGEKGAITKLCEKVDQKYTLVDGDRDIISQIVWILYSKWKSGKLEYGCDKSKLAEFSRHELSLKYARIIKEKFNQQ